MKTISKAEACVMVIFGATGDLTKRKLFPALYNLARDGFMPDNFAIIGVGRQEMTSADFRREMHDTLREYSSEENTRLLDWFCERTYYTGGDFDDDVNLFGDIKDQLAEVCEKYNIPPNFFYYMAIPPQLFANVSQKIVKNGLGKEENGNWRRFIFEKPFGRDLTSAKKLNADLLKILKERQIYRIDHYLGKETVQNLLVFRFANSIFEPVWNRNFVDHVQITVSETLGVEQRGGYYDTAGALRDMVPNHIFQLVTLTAMEPPVSFEANAVRDEQLKVLHAIKPFTARDVKKNAVRGQYGKANEMAAYRSEKDVKRGSTTETFAALKFSIDNWRWAGVPFYIRTGKRLKEKNTSIIIQFKKAPFMFFRETGVEKLHSNYIEIHVQPDEGITLHFSGKVPGPVVKIGRVDMDFNYRDHFGDHTGTGYERLLFDCMIGDATLFQRADMVERSWSIVTPIINAWEKAAPEKFPNYKSGEWGPKESDEMMARDGRIWREPSFD